MAGFDLVGTERTLRVNTLEDSVLPVTYNNIVFSSGKIVLSESYYADSILDYVVYSVDGTPLDIEAVSVDVNSVGTRCELLNFTKGVDDFATIRINFKLTDEDLVRNLSRKTSSSMVITFSNEVVKVPLTLSIKLEPVELAGPSHLTFNTTVCSESTKSTLLLFNPSTYTDILIMGYSSPLGYSLSEFFLDTKFPLYLPASTSKEIVVTFTPLSTGRKEVPVTFISNAQEKKVIFVGYGAPIADTTMPDLAVVENYLDTADLGVTRASNLAPDGVVTYPTKLIFPTVALGETVVLPFPVVNKASFKPNLEVRDFYFRGTEFALEEGSFEPTKPPTWYIDLIGRGMTRTYSIAFTPKKIGITKSVLTIRTEEGNISCVLAGYVEPTIRDIPAPTTPALPPAYAELMKNIAAPVVIGKEYYSKRTIINSSHLPMMVTAVTIAPSQEFTITNVNSIVGGVVLPEESVTLDITYKPLSTVKKTPDVQHTYILQGDSKSRRAGQVNPINDSIALITQGGTSTKAIKYLFLDYYKSGMVSVDTFLEQTMDNGLTYSEISVASNESPLSSAIAVSHTTFDSTTVNVTLSITAKASIGLDKNTRVKVVSTFNDGSTHVAYVALLVGTSMAGVAATYKQVNNEYKSEYSLATACRVGGYVGGVPIKAIFGFGASDAAAGLSSVELVGDSSGFSISRGDGGFAITGTSPAKVLKKLILVTRFADNSTILTPVDIIVNPSKQSGISNLSLYADVIARTVVADSVVNLTFPVTYTATDTRVVIVENMTPIDGLEVSLTHSGSSSTISLKGTAINNTYNTTQSFLYVACTLFDRTVFYIKLLLTIEIPKTEFEPDFTNLGISIDPKTQVFRENFKTIAEYGVTDEGNFQRQWDYASGVGSVAGICTLTRLHRSLKVQGSQNLSVNYTLFNWRAITSLIGTTVEYILVMAVPTSGYHVAMTFNLGASVTVHIGGDTGEPLYINGVLTNYDSLVWVEDTVSKRSKFTLTDNGTGYSVLLFKVKEVGSTVTIYTKEKGSAWVEMHSRIQPVTRSKPTLGIIALSRPSVPTVTNTSPLYFHNLVATSY